LIILVGRPIKSNGILITQDILKLGINQIIKIYLAGFVG
jgi:hypothetical protein